MFRRIVDSAAAMAVSVEVALMPGTGGVDVIEGSLSFREVRRRYAATTSSRSSTGRRVKREFVHAKKRIAEAVMPSPIAGAAANTPACTTSAMSDTAVRYQRRRPSTALARTTSRSRARGTSAIATRVRRPDGDGQQREDTEERHDEHCGRRGGQHPHVHEQHRHHSDDDGADDERAPPRVAEPRPEGADRAEPAVAVLAEGAEGRRDAGRAQRRGEGEERPRVAPGRS